MSTEHLYKVVYKRIAKIRPTLLAHLENQNFGRVVDELSGYPVTASVVTVLSMAVSNRPPAANYMPSNVSDDGVKIWKLMFRDPEAVQTIEDSAHGKRGNDGVSAQWLTAVRMYKKRCHDRSVIPYIVKKSQKETVKKLIADICERLNDADKKVEFTMSRITRSLERDRQYRAWSVDKLIRVEKTPIGLAMVFERRLFGGKEFDPRTFTKILREEFLFAGQAQRMHLAMDAYASIYVVPADQRFELYYTVTVQQAQILTDSQLTGDALAKQLRKVASIFFKEGTFKPYEKPKD